MEKSRLKLFTVLSHGFNIFALALIIGYGVWFISSGRYPNFHYLENYYVDLSQAFLEGQVALLQQPDPRLAALADPHDAPASRIPYLWDMSYYHGKYYLYWGPTPALFYVIYSAMKGEPAPAQLGVLAAYVGIAGVLLAFLYILRRKFFPRAPASSIGVFLLAACLNPAYAFLLSRPLTYETAILSGQLFLLVGLFFWLLYLVYRKGWVLIFTGLFWGLAVLARYDAVISVVVYTGAALLFFWRSRLEGRGDAETARQEAREYGNASPPLRVLAPSPRPSSPASQNAILLLAPLVLCALALEFYNVVRFGSPFETGLKYQLTTPVIHYYSSQYILSNLYVYLLVSNPVLPRFPFITISRFKPADLPRWAALANVIKDGKQFDFGFFGLFHSTPIFWFEGLALLILAGIWIYRRVSAAAEGRRDDAAGRDVAPLGVAVPVTGEAFGDRRVRPQRAGGAFRWPPGWLAGNGNGRPQGPHPTGVIQSDPQSCTAIRMITIMLLLAGLLQLVFLLFYYYSAVRFLSDFFLPLALGGFLIVWQADRFLSGKGWLRGVFWLGLVYLALQSVAIAFFSGLNLFPYYFAHHNPALWREVIALSARYQGVIYALLKPASVFH